MLLLESSSHVVLRTLVGRYVSPLLKYLCSTDTSEGNVKVFFFVSLHFCFCDCHIGRFFLSYNKFSVPTFSFFSAGSFPELGHAWLLIGILHFRLLVLPNAPDPVTIYAYKLYQTTEKISLVECEMKVSFYNYTHKKRERSNT